MVRRTDHQIDSSRALAKIAIKEARAQGQSKVWRLRRYATLLEENALPPLTDRRMKEDLKHVEEGRPAQPKLMKRRAERDRARERKQEEREKHAVVPVPIGERFDAFKAWAEKLVIPDGVLIGQKFRIVEFQEEFLRGALDGGKSESWMVIARGNAKTSTGLLLAGAMLFGPLNARRAYSAYLSLDGERSRKAFAWLEAMYQDNGLEGAKFVKSPVPMVYGWNGAEMTFIADSKGGGHSFNLTGVAILDEVGLWEANRQSQLVSMRDAAAKGGGKVIALTVRGFSDFVSEAERRSDLDFVDFVCYEGNPELPVDDEQNWIMANPGLLSGIKPMEPMRERAATAKMTPSELGDFRAFQLNLPVDPDVVELVPLEYVRRLYDEDCELANEPVFLGVDFGGETSMTAAVAIGQDSGKLRCWGVFPLGAMNLRERGLRDGVGSKYSEMEERGDLWTQPGIVVDYIGFMYEVLGELMAAGCSIAKVGSDRYNVHFLRQALADLNLLHLWEPRGTGAGKVADGSADVRSFQRCVAQKRLSMRPNLLFEEGMRAARVRIDMGGNYAIDKRRWNHRQDVATAAVLAAGFFDRQEKRPALRLEVVGLDYV